MLFDPKTIGWRHHGNCIIIMPLGHYATLLIWLRIFDATDLYHTSVANPGFPWGWDANSAGANIRFCQIFSKLHEIERTWIRLGGVPRASLDPPLYCTKDKVAQLASGFTPLGLASLKYLVTDVLPLTFPLKPFRIVFLHQFSLPSDTVTFHLCSVIEERITNNVIRLTMSW